MLIRTQILFPKDLIEELRILAAEKGWSVSETVRTIVKNNISKGKEEKKNAGTVLIEAAKWARRHKIKGPKDLGTNDEYLYGKLAPDYPLRKKR